MPCPLFERFAKQVARYGDKPAFLMPNTSWTYAQLYAEVEQLALSLLSVQSDFSHPIRVFSVCEDLSQNIRLALALAKMNGVLIAANAQSPLEPLLEFADAVQADLIVTEPHHQAWLSTGWTKPCLDFKQLMNLQGSTSNSSLNSTEPQTEPVESLDDAFLIVLSSGSTGKPKPIVISQAIKLARAQQTIDLYGLTAQDKILNASPFFHSLGQRLSFVPLMVGATLVVLPKFTPKAWIEAVERHQISFTIPVSSHLYALEPILEPNFERLRSLNCLVTSSAPIDSEFKKRFQNEVSCQLHEIYGATEIAIATNLSPQAFADKAHSVGTPCKQVEIRILDHRHQPMPKGELGEIAVKTPLMFSGYDQLPELTNQAMSDGFFLTGDLGYVDEDDYLVYVSRQKDVIISGGINIFPAVVEQALLSVSEVTQVCVIGVKDSLFGEVVIAVCVADAECEGALRVSANQKLAPHQRPIGYFFVESLPLTASGKVDKLSLREQYDSMDIDWSAPIRALIYR